MFCCYSAPLENFHYAVSIEKRDTLLDQKRFVTLAHIELRKPLSFLAIQVITVGDTPGQPQFIRLADIDIEFKSLVGRQQLFGIEGP